jgi:hypothetical protein
MGEMVPSPKPRAGVLACQGRHGRPRAARSSGAGDLKTLLLLGSREKMAGVAPSNTMDRLLSAGGAEPLVPPSWLIVVRCRCGSRY